jgi:hypothetical protein
MKNKSSTKIGFFVSLVGWREDGEREKKKAQGEKK